MKFYKETNFQETQIGKISKEWKIVKLEDSEVTSLIKSGSTPAKNRADYWNGAIPFVTIRDMTKTGKYLYKTESKITEFAIKSSNTFFVPENSILLSMYGTVGKVVINKIPIAISQNIAAIIPNRECVDSEFLHYALMHYSFQFKSAKIITLKHLDIQMVKNAKIPLPSLEEQRAIAEILSTVDEAIQRTDEIIAKTERLKKALMNELLTGRIRVREENGKLTLHTETEFQETEIGKIPKEWEVVKLEQVVEINKESIDPIKEIPNETFIYIDIDSIESSTGKIRNPKRILGRSAPSRARRVIHENDVIMSTVRPYLKAFAIVPKEYNNQICSTGFAVLTCKNLILPYFLLNVLFSDNTIAQCNRMMVGGQYPALNQSQVSRIKIPLPPLQEQQKIAEILSTVDKKLEVERNEKAKLERIKQGLMDLLLTGKIRIKVSYDGQF